MQSEGDEENWEKDRVVSKLNFNQSRKKIVHVHVSFLHVLSSS